MNQHTYTGVFLAVLANPKKIKKTFKVCEVHSNHLLPINYTHCSIGSCNKELIEKTVIKMEKQHYSDLFPEDTHYDLYDFMEIENIPDYPDLEFKTILIPYGEKLHWGVFEFNLEEIKKEINEFLKENKHFLDILELRSNQVEISYGTIIYFLDEENDD